MNRYLGAWVLALAGCDRPGRVPAAFVAVGSEHPPLPAGVVEEAGLLLPARADTAFSLALLRRGTERVLVLARGRVGTTAARAPRWQVRAVQPVAALRAGERVVLGVCAVAGTDDPRVVAVGRWTDGGAVRDVAAAWRADPERERFVTLPAARVACAVDPPDTAD